MYFSLLFHAVGIGELSQSLLLGVRPSCFLFLRCIAKHTFYCFHFWPSMAGQTSSRKTSTSALLTAKAFDYVDHNKLCKILQEMEIPDHLICLLRNLYAGREATIRTGHGTTDWFQIWKGVHQGCILSPCLFDLYAEYIMRNARLDETQAGIRIAGRNINNLRYADDTTLMAESEEELRTS